MTGAPEKNIAGSEIPTHLNAAILMTELREKQVSL